MYVHCKSIVARLWWYCWDRRCPLADFNVKACTLHHHLISVTRLILYPKNRDWQLWTCTASAIARSFCTGNLDSLYQPITALVLVVRLSCTKKGGGIPQFYLTKIDLGEPLSRCANTRLQQDMLLGMMKREIRHSTNLFTRYAPGEVQASTTKRMQPMFLLQC